MSRCLVCFALWGDVLGEKGQISQHILRATELGILWICYLCIMRLQPSACVRFFVAAGGFPLHVGRNIRQIMGRNKCGAQTVACAVIEERQKLDARDEDRREKKQKAQKRTLLLRDWIGFRGGCVGFQVGFGGVVFQWISVFCFGFY